MEEEASALYSVLKEIFLLLDDGDRRLLTAFDLTVPRFYALLHLGENPGISVSELSALMFCDKSNITRLVQGLEADELVRRQRHDSDGRIFCLYLTPAGDELRREVLALHRRHNDRRFDVSLSVVEQQTLLSSLQKLKHALQIELEEIEISPEPVS